MSKPLRDRLRLFIEGILKGSGQDLNGQLQDDTSLLQSGILDSLAVLQLAGWIESEAKSATDLATVDLPNEWDSISKIMDFVERHK